MTTGEFCWDSFPPKELEGVKDQKNSGADHKRRHDDLPRYNAPSDGNRKPRGPPFNNRNNNGNQQRVSESKHDTHGGSQFNRGPPGGQRKPRTASDSYETDRPKSGPPKSHNNGTTVPTGNGRPHGGFRSSNIAPQRDQDHHSNETKHRSTHTQANVKSEKESNTEKELRVQIMRMKGHMLYLKDQNAYKDQVIHHKDQVILALRSKLEKLKEGSSKEADQSTSPVEPKKPEDIDKMEADLATESSKEELEQHNGHDHEENGEHHEEETTSEKKEIEETPVEEKLPQPEVESPRVEPEQPETEEVTCPQEPQAEPEQQPTVEEPAPQPEPEQPKEESQPEPESEQATSEEPQPEQPKSEEPDQPRTEENPIPQCDQCDQGSEKLPVQEDQPVLTENNC